MSVVLVVEPDVAQASLLRRMQNRVGAELILVKSTDAAVEAIDRGMPDLILLSALLSPRDEDRLMTHLRSLGDASHLQTLTIPQLRHDGETASEGRKKGFSFRKKPVAAVSSGCDPAMFAEEIVAQLERASDMRSRPARRSIRVLEPEPEQPESVFTREPASVLTEEPASVFTEEPASVLTEEPASVFTEELVEAAVIDEPIVATPFIDEPFIDEPMVATPFIDAPVIDDPFIDAPVIDDPVVDDPVVDQPVAIEPLVESPLVFEPPVVQPLHVATTHSIDDELDRLARELGVSLDSGAVQLQNDDSAERLAAEVALVQAEAESRLVAELERVRGDAEERRLTELTRLQADADAMREAAIAEARAAAERETRHALATEVARVRSEAAGTVAEAVNRVKIEAEHTLSSEIGRAREDAETLRADLARVQKEATERARALEREVVGVRAQAEAHIKAELERIGKEAERARLADQSHAKNTVNEIREAAAREARAIAEAAAHCTLEAEVARVRSQADTILETELARVRAEAQERQTSELLALRAQMADMREAASEHARAAVEEAQAAAEQARTAVRKPAEVITFPVLERFESLSAAVAHVDTSDAREPDPIEEPTKGAPQLDYYSLWQEKWAELSDTSRRTQVAAPATPYQYRRWLKWGVPVAASLLLVVMSGGDTVARLASPAPDERASTRVMTEIPQRETVTALESKLGILRVESTPTGATILLDGQPRGETPRTISDLRPGTHTLVLKSSAGIIARSVTVRAGQTAIASEAIFAGWLAIFSPIAIDITLDGVATRPTEDGRIMVAPGTYRVQITNARFNFRRTETLTVKPGEVTAHTVSLPTGALKISVPDGTEVRVDGQSIGKAPFAETLPLVVGTHELRATHPVLGDRRTAVDVKFQETTEATLSFDP